MSASAICPVECAFCRKIDKRALEAPCADHPGMKIHALCWRKLRASCPVCNEEIADMDLSTRIIVGARRTVELLLVACALVPLIHNHFYLLCTIAYIASYSMQRLRRTERCVVAGLSIAVIARIIYTSITVFLTTYPIKNILEHVVESP